MNDGRNNVARAARSDINHVRAKPRASSTGAAAAASAATTAIAHRDCDRGRVSKRPRAAARVRLGEEIETTNDAPGDAARAARRCLERARASPRVSSSASSVATEASVHDQLANRVVPRRTATRASAQSRHENRQRGGNQDILVSASRSRDEGFWYRFQVVSASSLCARLSHSSL